MSRASDRRRWQHMIETGGAPSPEALRLAQTDKGVAQKLESLVEIWGNNLYTATVYRAPDGEVSVIGVHRHDRSYIRDWRHLQQIKNDIAGAEAEAVELFPAESRLLDQANETWLWVLDKPAPFGWKRRDVGDERQAAAIGARQRPLPSHYPEARPA